MGVIRYPRGFYSPGEAPVVNSNGDTEVCALFDLLTRDGNIVKQFEWQKRVLQCAYRLFGDWNCWSLHHLKQGLGQRSQQYLVETIGFLRGEPRTVKPMIALGLMDDGHPEHALYRGPVGDTDQCTPRALQMWTQQPNGFTDLCLSLYVFFGRKAQV